MYKGASTVAYKAVDESSPDITGGEFIDVSDI
jgi:hypothetical protein